MVDSLKFVCHFVWKLKFAIAVPNQYNRVFIDLRNPPPPPSTPSWKEIKLEIQVSRKI